MAPAEPSLLQTLRARWAEWTGAPKREPLPEVIVHDPAAEGPQDLDDVFRDRDTQERMAAAIARAARGSSAASPELQAQDDPPASKP